MPKPTPYPAGARCFACEQPIESERSWCRCDTCLAAVAREYRTRPGVRERKVELFREKAYGITQAEYDDRFTKQDGLCCICGRPERALRGGQIKTLAVDHDHSTGRVRGLLCQSCNTALGLLDDSIETLRQALIYLGGDDQW